MMLEFIGGVFSAVMHFQTKSMRETLIAYLTSEFFALFDVLEVLLRSIAMHNFHVLLQVEPCRHLFVANGALILLGWGGLRLDILNFNIWLSKGGKYIISRNELFFLFFIRNNGLHRLFNRFDDLWLLGGGLGARSE